MGTRRSPGDPHPAALRPAIARPPARAGSTGRAKSIRLNETEIYRRIYDAVLDHRLQPGTKLKEVALAEAFGANRGVVRKVLTRLAYDRLVALRPNRGAVVAIPSVEEGRDLFAARRAAEAAIAGNGVLAEFLDQLIARTPLVVLAYRGRGADRTCSIDEHIEIIDAIATGNVAKAVAAMTSHLESLEGQLDLSDEA